MASTQEAAERTAFLQDLNARVDSAERYFTSLKQARDIVVGDMLNGSGGTSPTPHQHRPRRRRTNKSGAPRVQRLKTVLFAAPGPVSVSDIKAEFERQGWTDERPLISSTLSYLKRIGVANQTERGMWVGASEAVHKQAA